MSYPVTDNEPIEITTVKGSPFDIKKFFYKLVGFLPFILLSLLIAFVGGRLYLRWTPSQHRVSANLLIKNDNETSPDYTILRELGVMPGSKEVQNQIDILQSYDLSESVVDSLNLQVKVFTQARIASSYLYGIMSPIVIRPVSSDTASYQPGIYLMQIFDDYFTLESVDNEGKVQSYPYKEAIELGGKKVYVTRNFSVKANANGYSLEIAPKKSTVMAVRNALTVVKLHDMGGILEIAMLDVSPLRAMDIINAIMEAFNAAALKDKNLAGVRTAKFVSERVDSVESELDVLEMKAELFKRSNRINDISSAGSIYLNEAMNYDKEGIAQNGLLQLLDGLEKSIKNAKDFTEVIPAYNGINEPTLAALINAYNSSVLAYQEQQKISTVKDPVLKRQKEKLTDLRENIFKNINSIRAGFATRISQLKDQQNNFENLLASLPEKEREYIKLKRQIAVKESLYLYLLQKKEETELALVSTINDSRVVDPALDQGIVFPKSDQVMLFSMMLGLIFPVGVMLLLEMFNNKISDRKEIEENCSIPIIGELSYNKSSKNRIVPTQSRSPLAEQFRLIGANIRFIAHDKNSKVIVVSSFMSGEGKSFVSINLAGSLCMANSKVLVIEMDLRKPNIKKYLNINPAAGLTDYIIHEKEEEAIICTSEALPNVDIITSGSIPPNPAELLMHEKVAQLINWAKKKYQYIIIDSSPVGLVADVFLFSKFSDITLFIIRHKFSFKTTLKFVEKLSNEQKVPKVQLVVNSIHEPGGIRYGYNYGYGYGYGQGYGYGYNYGYGYWNNNGISNGKKIPFFSRILGK